MTFDEYMHSLTNTQLHMLTDRQIWEAAQGALRAASQTQAGTWRLLDEGETLEWADEILNHVTNVWYQVPSLRKRVEKRDVVRRRMNAAQPAATVDWRDMLSRLYFAVLMYVGSNLSELGEHDAKKVEDYLFTQSSDIYFAFRNARIKLAIGADAIIAPAAPEAGLVGRVVEAAKVVRRMYKNINKTWQPESNPMNELCAAVDALAAQAPEKESKDDR